MNVGDEYTCEVCKGVFVTEWTDEEAASEREALFGAPMAPSDGIVCDDCWRAMGFGDD